MNVLSEHNPSIAAVDEAYHVGTFDLSDIRIKHKTWLNVLPEHSSNQRGLPYGHSWLN